MKPSSTAFTLLELVIALAIAATLAVFAVPSYRSHVARGHRIEVASALYRAAQFAEAAVTSESATLPAGLDQAPQFGRAVYQLRILPADDTNGGYAVEARPTEAGPMSADACGTFVLDAAGRRATTGSGEGSALTTDECWNTR